MTEQKIRYAEIVKDYACKDLSEGCVYKDNKDVYYKIKEGEHFDIKDFHNLEILGHIFDLSCVLRCAGGKYPGYTITVTEDGHLVKIQRRLFEYEYIMIDGKNMKIPLEPILTLTEQELEQLNNNLEELGKQES